MKINSGSTPDQPLIGINQNDASMHKSNFLMTYTLFFAGRKKIKYSKTDVFKKIMSRIAHVGLYE